MVDSNNQKLDIDAIVQRFTKAWQYRGFKDFEQCSTFLQMAEKTVREALGEELRCRSLAVCFGIESAWLMHGEGKMEKIPHAEWFDSWKHTGRLPHRDGPTRYPWGRRAPESLRLALPKARTTLPILTHRFDHEMTQRLALLQRLAAADPAYAKESRYQLSIGDVARMTFCLLVDHHEREHVPTDMREIVRATYNDLREHREQGVKAFAATKPSRRSIEHYKTAIRICDGVLQTVARDRGIDLSAFRPKPAPKSASGFFSSNVRLLY